MHICELYIKCAKLYEDYACTPPPQEDDELVDILSHVFADELHEVAVTVLAEVLGAHVRQRIFDHHVMNADLALTLLSSIHACTKTYLSAMYFREKCTCGSRGRTVPMCCRCTAARCRSSRPSPAPTAFWSRRPSSSLSELPPRALPPS